MKKWFKLIFANFVCCDGRLIMSLCDNFTFLYLIYIFDIYVDLFRNVGEKFIYICDSIIYLFYKYVIEFFSLRVCVVFLNFLLVGIL